MQIINGKIVTMDQRRIIENGFVTITNGIITEVGSMEEYEDNFDEKLDASGKTVLPGLIDCHTHLGMWEDSIGFEGDDGNEDTDPATPQMRAIDGINPFDRCFDDALRAGVTTVVTGPGSANPIGGQTAILKTGGKTVEDKLLLEPFAIKAALGENPKTTYHSKNQSPVTRMATAAIIREQLARTKKYKRDIDASMKDEDLEEPELDIKCEALLPVLNGELPVHFHAHRADDILTAVRIAEEFNIKFAVVHCTDGQIVSDILAKKNIPALCGPVLCDRSKPELKNLSPKTPGVLSEAGVLTAIVTDHPVVPIEYLPLSAALCVKEGMDYLAALEAITINPAIICGIDERVGSITVGKDADIAIFSGYPLDVFSKCEYVFINGELSIYA